jgi:epoxide hydrolase 4
MPPTIRQTAARVNGVTLHYAEAGSGQVVLLLHGFPDYWVSWRRQLEGLASQGFRAVAPDLRGYGQSERPRGAKAYRLDALGRDIAALATHLGAPVHLVGHDWGGAVAWHVAMHHPSQVRSLSILNAPHPRAFARELRRSWSQRLRSWYIAAFQLPWLPELVLRATTSRVFSKILREGRHSREDRRGYVQAFSTPHAWSAALHYYRAALRYPPAAPVPITRPTQVIWGMRDPYLSARLLEGLDRWVEQIVVHRLAQAAHWPHWSHPREVTTLLRQFMRRH